ncbi:uncharacterized protein BX663DRAFT_477655 [Cokeromyces recurvatus]|uniref:uncharacterized protein n=1 Tax=Cokeromyces recurvatus TaxID=90255 RepID=UPI00221F5C77|nr:uncharacterized protein BX663DRAFT_477655 [Cokeromyces recurvatus]KAI7900042.1 hypothetical protein BX663DRAFT_477655 [Cokeromyces recurvatus]
MKILFIIAILTVTSTALVNDVNEDCTVINPIGNTIIMAGDKMKIAWVNSHVSNFSNISLVQADGNRTPIIIAENVPTAPGQIVVNLPRTLIPSNAYYMTLGTKPYQCQSGNLRIIGAAASVPDPKVPETFNNQISSGRFPKSLDESNASYIATTTIATVLLIIGSMLILR